MIDNKKGPGLSPLLLLILTAVFSCLISGCGRGDEISSAEQLKEKGRIIGVAADTSEGALVEQEFPDAKIEYFSGEMAAYTSVAQGKADAFIFNKLSMEIAIRNGLEGVRVLDETIGEPNRGAVAFSPRTKIPDLEAKVNEFLREKESDGTLDDMKERWLFSSDPKMPDIPVAENPEYHLKVGTTGLNMPFTYYKGTEISGYDIELARRFAAWLGASLEFKVYDYDGIIPAAQSGDIDCIFANLFITPERSEAIKFSNPTFVGEIGILVRDAASPTGGAGASDQSSAKPQAADYADKRIAVLSGTNFPEILDEVYPNAEQEFFNTVADVIAAVQSDKADAGTFDEPVARSILTENDSLEIAEGFLAEFEFAYTFPKTDEGKALSEEVSEFIRAKKEDGTLAELQSKWFDTVPEESMMPVKLSDLPDINGTIHVATLQYPPFSMMGQETYFGYDAELLALFGQEKGYAIEFTDMNADAILPAIKSSKFEMGAAATAITEERKESIYFSEPEYSGGVVLLVNKETARGGSFISKMISSFEKTFIREDRYKLFLQGIGMTIMIVICAMLLGTLLGLLIFMSCRKGNPIANKVAGVFNWLMSGMPMVVLLMILYYIVFSKVSISGAAVSVIAFAMTFGADVYGMLKTSIAAVGTGQMEAAYALGYSDRKAFFKHIVPQALPYFMPAYRGALVSLTKATSIVGYVAVQDLTKMGDIVRSRTYEAFFPLIAVAVIYFVLAAILVYFVNRATLRLDPTRRPEEDILKGVNVHD